MTTIDQKKKKLAAKPVKVARAQIDWEAIQMRYRTGTESLRSIGAYFQVTEGAIRQKAKKDHWSRDLQAKVREATEALLISHSATHDVRTESQSIAIEAQMRAGVVLGHRTGLKRLGAMRNKLLDEVEVITDNPMEFEKLGELLDDSGPDSNGTWRKDKLNEAYRKVISLSQRISDTKTIAEIDEKIRKGEREAFGIDGVEDKSSNVDAMLSKLGITID